ncbi:MGMT family protein [Rothia uropygioeca]|uniref:MGMT family protein n=1 Tax=Kocuria sp. 257 TaxID=2021970 RepID=UPI001010EC70|nr:MGMT family protein [Kocuria sp. 257]
MDDLRVERILRAVECVPTGRVATYGLIGRIVGESPRVVGNVLARWGSSVPWWRVVNAQGVIPGHGGEAYDHWVREDLLDLATARPDRSGAGGVVRVRVRTLLAEESCLRLAWARAIKNLDDEGPADPGTAAG